MIGDHVETSAPDKVEEDMIALLEEYNSKVNVTLENIVNFHYRFESITPIRMATAGSVEWSCLKSV